MKSKAIRRGLRGSRSRPLVTSACERLEARQVLSVTTGDLDPSFGSNGKVVTDLGFQEPTSDFATDLAVYQADGKFVVVGYEEGANYRSDMVVARYNSDGSLDTTFGNGGKARVDFTTSLPSNDYAWGVAIDAQGKIVLAGSSGSPRCVVARLNPDGSLDSSFSGDGKVLIEVPFDCRAVALDSQGRIVLAGKAVFFSDELVVARLNLDGSLDSTFATGGLQQIALTIGSEYYATSVAVDSQDRIIVGGRTDQGTNGGNWDFLVARLADDGTLDATFAGTGMTVIDLGGNESARGVVVDDQDRVVLAGAADGGTDGSNWDFAVVRLKADGSLDGTFNETGMQIVDFGTSNDVARDITIDSQHRLVIVGSVRNTLFDGDFASARLKPDGSLDASFSGDGKQTIDFGMDDAGVAVAVDAQGRILVAGQTTVGQSILFGIARLTGTQTPVANAGGPYSGTEGSIVSFDGSASTSEDDVIVSYEWDLDFDGVTFNADRTGVNATAFYSDNFGPRTIALRVTNSNGLSSLSTTTLTVDNVRPTASIAGPSIAVREQLVTLTLSGNDISTADYGAGFMYSVDFGDGVTTTVGAFNGSSARAVSHTWFQAGSYTVTVSSIDKDGGVSEPVVMTVQVSSVAVLDDPCKSGASALYVVGSASGDTIVISPVGNTNDLEVRINGQSQGTYSPSSDGHIYVYGLDGDDDIQLAGSVTRSAWMYGGSGNDRLKGGGGHDVLFGDEGDDVLAGQSGRDFLIGGNGADRIVGNAEDDILVSGWLAFDFSPYDADPSVNLHNTVGTIDSVDRLVCGVMREWTSWHSYGERIYNISHGAQKPTESGTYASRLNENYFLNLSTWGDDMESFGVQNVFEDNAQDVLTGSAGLDWFWFDLQEDRVTDLRDEVYADIMDWLAW